MVNIFSFTLTKPSIITVHYLVTCVQSDTDFIVIKLNWGGTLKYDNQLVTAANQIFLFQGSLLSWGKGNSSGLRMESRNILLQLFIQSINQSLFS